jgi:hypothetical protein
VTGFENAPVYQIMPAIPEDAKPYLFGCLVLWAVLFFMAARAARLGVSLPWLVRYWMERLKAK